MKEEYETETVKRRSEGCFSVEAFKIFLIVSLFLVSWCVLCLMWTDVLVLPSSVVTEFCDVSSMCSDWEFVEPQSFSLSKKRAFCCTDMQEEMRYEGSPVKAHPPSRRRMTPSTLVAEWSKWDKYKRAPWRQHSSASASDVWRQEAQEQLIVSWSPVEKSVIDALEDYLESCAQVIVDIDVVERLLRPENFEVSLRYVLKHATGRGSNIFQLFDTSEKPNHFVASRRRCLESQGRNGARQENGRNEWYPTALCRLPCFSTARRRLEKKKIIGT